MSVRTIMVLALALICGLAAAGGVFWMKNQSDGRESVKTMPVVFALEDIQRGETIKNTMVEIRQVPLDAPLPPGFATIEEVLERSAHIQMLKGDVLTDAKLAKKGAGTGMASLIKPGMRAFTIQTPSLSSSLAGFLLPGNRVDVLFTTSTSGGPDDPSGGATTSTLLMDLEILAVHTTVDTPATNKIDLKEALSVTLLVKPDEAAMLDLGQNKGTLHLSLRNPIDKGNDKIKTTSMVDILQLPERKPKKQPDRIATVDPLPPRPAPPSPPPMTEVTYSVRTLRGTRAGADQLTIRTRAGVPVPEPQTRDLAVVRKPAEAYRNSPPAP